METGAALRKLRSPRVLGWRAWTVTETPAGVRLGSVIYEGAWVPGEVARATCQGAESPPHEIPGLDCACGFHAAHDPVDAISYLRGRDEVRTIGRVLGEVVLSGAIVETETGWRAEAAYPARLYVEDPDIATELAVYGVPVLSGMCASPSSQTCTATPSLFIPSSRTSIAKTLT
jgi:hypothetical protein